jgi:RND family efflux transporter MFP subunit
MSASRIRPVLLPLGILLLGALIYAVLMATRPTPARRTTPPPRPLVQIFVVPATVPEIEVTGFGTVRAQRQISLVPQVSGVVVQKAAAFEPGEFFRAGDLLLRIDDSDYRLAAERAVADVARAEYNLATAEEEAFVAQREWERLHNNGPADGPKSGVATDAESSPDPTPPVEAPHPLVLRLPQLNLARADLAAARAAAERARVDLTRCTIEAPFTGRVLAADVDEGQYIRAGSTVGNVYATDVAEVMVSISDADMAWIDVPQEPGDDRSGSEADVYADFAGRRHHWRGAVVRMAGAIDAQSRLVPVVVEIPDPYRRQGDRPPLVEGMFVQVVIRGRSLPGAVAIPREALRADDRVWTVDSEERLRIRDVAVARVGVETAVITDGLAAGETICLSSLPIVSDGMQVKTTASSAGRDANASETVRAAASIDSTSAGAATADKAGAGGQAE